jgi:hypothetical protein
MRACMVRGWAKLAAGTAEGVFMATRHARPVNRPGEFKIQPDWLKIFDGTPVGTILAPPGSGHFEISKTKPWRSKVRRKFCRSDLLGTRPSRRNFRPTSSWSL